MTVVKIKTKNMVNNNQIQKKIEPEQPGILSKIINIMVLDLKTKIYGVPDGWEDYRRFVELAKGGQK